MLLSAADLIQIALLITVIFQLHLSRKSFKADHERRKKQATFEFINAVSDRFRGALHQFNERHGRNVVVDYS